jgi:hypothetical protein
MRGECGVRDALAVPEGGAPTHIYMFGCTLRPLLLNGPIYLLLANDKELFAEVLVCRVCCVDMCMRLSLGH